MLSNDLGRLYQDSSSQLCRWLWVPSRLTSSDMLSANHAFLGVPAVPRSRLSRYQMTFALLVSQEAIDRGRQKFEASVSGRPLVDGAPNPCSGKPAAQMEVVPAQVDLAYLYANGRTPEAKVSVAVGSAASLDGQIEITIMADALDPAAEPATLQALSSRADRGGFLLTAVTSGWPEGSFQQNIKWPILVQPSEGQGFYGPELAQAIAQSFEDEPMWKCARHADYPMPAPEVRSAPESCKPRTLNPGV